ncbi:MAG TPA: SpoIIE family protein phosphatase [Pirellulales bacterium]|nr:SpoIIE family protein phosphatase [Pirellulales bacterium]
MPSYLRLYSETRPASSGRFGDFWPGVDKLCRAFEQATGWPLQCLPEPAASNSPAGILWSAPASPDAEQEQLHVAVASVEGPASVETQIELPAAVELAGTIGHLLAELARARQALWKREAELAAGVPLSPRTGEPHLAQRLQAALRAATEAASCDAAALYLVDETTSYLKLRSVWGLPQERLLLPPRDLPRCPADLEALLGHAVVVQDAAAQAEWRPPEPFAAAVCLPVASATAPLGTLWVFGDRSQDFSDRELNMVEIVAGRIAVELEREMLATAGADASRLKRQIASAERLQDRNLPHVSPLSDLWQIAAWTQSAGELNGEFYDWFVRGDDLLALVLGSSRHEAIEGALSAGSLRAAARAHLQYADDPAAVLRRLSESFWSGSPGDETAGLLVAVADSHTPAVRLAAAGCPAVWKIADRGATRLTEESPAIGLDPLTRYTVREEAFSSGELLVVLGEGAVRMLRAQEPAGEQEMIELLGAHRDQPAGMLVELLHDRLTALAAEGHAADCTAMVLKCRDSLSSCVACNTPPSR